MKNVPVLLMDDLRLKIDAYAIWTDATAQYSINAEPFYLALGVADEFGELHEAGIGFDADAIAKEAGDVCWYLARYCTRVLKLPFSCVVEEAMAVDTLPMVGEIFSALGALCGVEKKRIRDGENWTAELYADKWQKAKRAVVLVMYAVLDFIDASDSTLEEVMTINQAKLSARLEAGTIKGDGDQR